MKKFFLAALFASSLSHAITVDDCIKQIQMALSVSSDRVITQKAWAITTPGTKKACELQTSMTLQNGKRGVYAKMTSLTVLGDKEKEVTAFLENNSETVIERCQSGNAAFQARWSSKTSTGSTEITEIKIAYDMIIDRLEINTGKGTLVCRGFE